MSISVRILIGENAKKYRLHSIMTFIVVPLTRTTEIVMANVAKTMSTIVAIVDTLKTISVRLSLR